MKPSRLYKRFAASRDGREVRSTVVAPWRFASASANLFSASPTPLPRASVSTTTSSIHARTRRAEIEAAAAAVKSALADGAPTPLKQAVQRLDAATETLAARLVDSAMEAALERQLGLQ